MCGTWRGLEVGLGLGWEGWLGLREFLGGEDIDEEDSNSALQLSVSHSLSLSLSKNRQTDTER
jgi:hypothetical protein